MGPGRGDKIFKNMLETSAKRHIYPTLDRSPSRPQICNVVRFAIVRYVANRVSLVRGLRLLPWGTCQKGRTPSMPSYDPYTYLLLSGNLSKIVKFASVVPSEISFPSTFLSFCPKFCKNL